MFSIIRRTIRSVPPAIVEMIYPKTCAGCGMRGMWLCDMCETSVPVATIPATCPRCALPALSGRCGCRNLPPVIDRARAAYVYDGWAANAVQQVKYHGEWARAEHLAAGMALLVAEFGAVDGLIPVPLHRSRERSRGFNQSLLFATHIGAITGVPVLDVLRRTRKTASQVTLSGDERRENVRDAFGVDPGWVPVPGGAYVVIDDVRTTGSTLGACVEALRVARPASVGVLTFALDMHRGQIEALRAHLAAGGVRAAMP